MIVNRFQINLTTIGSGTTATTINLPITLQSQEIGQSELIDKTFVDVEVEKAINPISDYDKVRFLPIDSNDKHVNDIKYNLTFVSGDNYGSIGFMDKDIKFEKSVFTESFLNLNFYDSDNPLTQRLITYTTIFSKLNPSDLLPDEVTQKSIYNAVIGNPGSPKPAHQVPLSFIVSSPIFNSKSFSEGYHLYDYRNELKIGEIKYLYMRASFKNAKMGKSTNLMVKNTAQKIDSLVHELYTRYILTRTSTGYYYRIDTTYQGVIPLTSNNVSYNNNNVTINLYQIQAL